MPIEPEQLRTWLAAAGRQDAAAFRALYDAAAPKLFGFAMRILRQRELAEEALQEGFVSIWHAAPHYEAGQAAPLTWMAAIVRNKALDILRRTDDTVELDHEAVRDEYTISPAEASEMSSDARALSACMAHLEGLHRLAIGLAFFHDLSHTEVAQRMSLPVGTVKTWIRRGMEKLKLCLSQGDAP
ncbi:MULTISPECIES: sigma-70 family RNA polymerase sigma factor [unclassified Duganella]|uniref:sigma-70 family RNA polymerase sigma factor n=1 Tax=unclassified Duganella TaxID=2636909 RepID=UPI0006F3ADA6|nr:MULTISPECIES: sigma-70 family RNA polymerase sigma factor [unclassified Duganella]KQV53704.1 RNA polymerase subunit sigma [Duganella sp. Root336D2]KRB83741.1 RNA polymerase subunit sigma [Duganella sp. Root198D2]